MEHCFCYPEKKKSTKTHKATVTELALNTGLIECGFSFGNRFREFFKQQTGEENFKFNVDMVATAKAVKESGGARIKIVQLK